MNTANKKEYSPPIERTVRLMEVLTSAGKPLTFLLLSEELSRRGVVVHRATLRRTLHDFIRFGHVDNSGRTPKGEILFVWQSRTMPIGAAAVREQATAATPPKKKKRDRQDPLWDTLLNEIANKKLAGNYAGRDQHYVASAEVVDEAEAILHRPPVLSDLTFDVVYLILRRFKERDMETRILRRRAKRLQELNDLATQRFNHPKIAWDEIPLVRRLTFNDLPPDPNAPAVPTFEDAPAGFDSHVWTMPLTKLLEHYIRERLAGRSRASVALMENSIRTFSRWLGRPAVLGDLRQNRVIDFLNYLMAESKLARGSIQTHRWRILSLWNFAAKKRWLPDFPEIRQIPVPERVPDSWSPDELTRLFKAAKARRGMIGAVPAGLYWETLLNICYDSAERIGGVLSVEFGNVSADGWLTVRAEHRKGKTRDKRYKLRPCTIACIARVREAVGASETRILRWPYSEPYLYNKFNEILDTAQLPKTRRDKFHKIRRTTASEFEAAGGNATELLDHTSRATTQKYLNPSVLKHQQPADIVPGVGEKPKAKKQSADDAEFKAKLRKLLDDTDDAA